MSRTHFNLEVEFQKSIESNSLSVNRVFPSIDRLNWKSVDKVDISLTKLHLGPPSRRPGCNLGEKLDFKLKLSGEFFHLLTH